MATPDFYLCDVCGERLPEENRLQVSIDRRLDEAGSMDDQVVVVDLCEKHSSKALAYLLKSGVLAHELGNAYELGKRLVAWVKQHKVKAA